MTFVDRELWRVLSVGAVTAAVVGSCASPPTPASLPAPSRSTDAAGYVDDAGRTGNERARTELSGMRATESGSQQPAGTPGSGLSVPLGPEPGGFAFRQQADPSVIPPERDATVARAFLISATRAYCDRERRCGRIGVDQRISCLREASTRLGEDVGRAGCRFSLDADLVATCVTAIRSTSCNLTLDGMSTLEPCRTTAMCLPP
jgi:hypothetical protein